MAATPGILPRASPAPPGAAEPPPPAPHPPHRRPRQPEPRRCSEEPPEWRREGGGERPGGGQGAGGSGTGGGAPPEPPQSRPRALGAAGRHPEPPPRPLPAGLKASRRRGVRAFSSFFPIFLPIFPLSSYFFPFPSTPLIPIFPPPFFFFNPSPAACTNPCPGQRPKHSPTTPSCGVLPLSPKLKGSGGDRIHHSWGHNHPRLKPSPKKLQVAGGPLSAAAHSAFRAENSNFRHYSLSGELTAKSQVMPCTAALGGFVHRQRHNLEQNAKNCFPRATSSPKKTCLVSTKIRTHQ